MSPTAPAATASGPSAATDRAASVVARCAEVALDEAEEPRANEHAVRDGPRRS